MKKVILGLILVIFSALGLLGQHGGHSTNHKENTSLTDGLGDISHPVSTTNPEAQKFYNQGLAYIYAFNHEEAVRSFRRAAELDANLAMAHWGAALALGSNYNVQADASQLKQALEHLQKAMALLPKPSKTSTISKVPSAGLPSGSQSFQGRRFIILSA